MSRSEAAGRYSVYSRNFFRKAPVSKLWFCCAFCGSLSLILLPESKIYFALYLPFLLRGSQLWKVFTSRLFFLNGNGIISGCLLIYYLRVIERRFGTRKYANFCLVSGIISFWLELLTLKVLQSFNIDLSFFASGPYSIVASSFVQYLLDVPYIPYARIYNLPFCSKNLPSLLALQMFLISPQISISCIIGILAGLLYRCPWLGLSGINVIPSWFNINPYIGWFMNLFEDNKGLVLPMAATIERQRQEWADRYEQRLIYEQMQRTHRHDQNASGGRQGLRYFRRLFPDANPPAGAEQPTEASVQRLMDMGFPNREQVIRALETCNNDLSDAAHHLLQQA